MPNEPEQSRVYDGVANLDVNRLLSYLLPQSWQREAKIVPLLREGRGIEWCVKYGKMGLKYSEGPATGTFWSSDRGDDFHSPELAFVALSKAPYPTPMPDERIIPITVFDSDEADILEIAFGELIPAAPRGIGMDSTNGCMICGGPKDALMNNIAAYCDKDAGEKILALFPVGARFEDRSHYDPHGSQIKIGACDAHLPNLKHLNGLMINTYRWSKGCGLNARMIQEAKNLGVTA